MDPIKVIANTISTLTILSCVFLKVPQIKNIIVRKSAEGMNIQAMLMEITGFTIVILYNFTNHYNVMTYLEYPIILFQVYIMLYYTLHFKNLMHESMVCYLATAYLSALIGFASGILPKTLLSYFMPFVTPINGMAKVSYIYGIIKAGNANAVSVSTWIISVLTNLSRLFTIYVDSADPMLLFNLFVSSMLSLGVLVTTLYYQHKLSKSIKNEEEEKEKDDKQDDRRTRVRHRVF